MVCIFKYSMGQEKLDMVPRGLICQSLARSKKKYPEQERGLGFQYPIGYLKLSALIEMNMRSLSWQWSVEGTSVLGAIAA